VEEQEEEEEEQEEAFMAVDHDENDSRGIGVHHESLTEFIASGSNAHERAHVADVTATSTPQEDEAMSALKVASAYGTWMAETDTSARAADLFKLNVALHLCCNPNPNITLINSHNTNVIKHHVYLKW